MPLGFTSVSHGEIAFGFFNIDSDMLLLDQTFFFVDAFCGQVVRLARCAPDVALESAIPAFVIDRPEDVGDLMDAIHGVRYTGFIGDTYLRYPFPERRAEFKQKPEGHETRDEFREMIVPYAREESLRFVAMPLMEEIAFGEVRFTRATFHELVAYVWRGGWPRWRDEERPDDVLAMKEAVDRSGNWAVRDLELST